MEKLDITFGICGMSGDGIISAGKLLTHVLSEAGYSIMAFHSYPAEIRGFGRCVARCRVGVEKRLALASFTDVLISLNDEQSLTLVDTLKDDAVVLFDNHPPTRLKEGQTIAGRVQPETDLFGIPFGNLSGAAGATTIKGRNIVALGSLAALYGIDPDLFKRIIAHKFETKGERVVEINLRCFENGYRYVKDNFAGQMPGLLTRRDRETNENRILISGTEAIGQAAVDVGCRLYFGYPITPATPLMELLAEKLPENGGWMVQMEDEIASIGAVLGSGFTGTRAMTATSGPGLALMTELITHGVMTEIPILIVDVQRAGPSTGLPTKTEQSDLQAAIFGGPGDTPRIVLAATDILDCYRLTLKSFQLAERYQTPVILLSDLFLNSRVENVALPAISPDDTADWNVYPDDCEKGPYHRFAITESGISPRSIPGTEGFMYTCSGLEQTVEGTPCYEPENHMTMSAKRYRKIQGALVDLPFPEEVFAEETGSGNLDVGVIAWGSTFGAALEAVQTARDSGLNAGILKIVSLYPYHADIIREFMDHCNQVLIPELNFEGQLANLIGHLCHQDIVRLARATGVPFTASVILENIETLSAGLTGKSN